MDIIEEAKLVFDIEIAELKKIRDRIDDEIEKAAEIIMAAKGKVVITGIGKSGLVGKKMAATFASTGTLSIFMNSAEGLHGYPIIFDATHSVQKPGGKGEVTGGDRDFVFPLMRAALATGVDGIFAEVHPDPDKGKSDAANMLRLDEIEAILTKAVEIDKIIKGV